MNIEWEHAEPEQYEQWAVADKFGAIRESWYVDYWEMGLDRDPEWVVVRYDDGWWVSPWSAENDERLGRVGPFPDAETAKAACRLLL